MLSPKNKRYFLEILPFGLLWYLFGMIYLLVEKGILGDINYYPATETPYNFYYSLGTLSVASWIAGILQGISESFFLNPFFARRTFGEKIFLKSLIYLAFIVVFLVNTSLILNALQLGTSIYALQNWTNVFKFVNNFAFWSIVIYIGAVSSICLFFLETSSNLGQGVLFNYLMGKYHKPREEERVFMFLDMKSSTKIAEKLGHVRYFELLKTYYADMSEAIINSEGKIYQYVGDEIVISWTKEKGAKKGLCLACFFDIEEAISSKSDWYKKRYGLVPTFKAGCHYGRVTAGEIGDIKKDIIYTGDVLNTTARIQSLCNHHQSKLLISGQLFSILPDQWREIFQAIGKLTLRGKSYPVTLYRHSDPSRVSTVPAVPELITYKEVQETSSHE